MNIQCTRCGGCPSVPATIRDQLAAAAEAAEFIRQEAELLRQSHTVDGTWDETEAETRLEYDRMLSLADRLEPRSEAKEVE